MKDFKHFKISEILYSAIATKKKIANTPTQEHYDNIVKLFTNVIEPLRVKFGKPLKITSGYRNQQVNKLVGGVPASQHTTGEACDINTLDSTLQKAFMKVCIDNIRTIPIDQLIIEFPDKTGTPKWCHISHSAKGPQRGEILVALKIGSKIVYKKYTKELAAQYKLA